MSLETLSDLGIKLKREDFFSYLMMKLKERIINGEFVTLEPFEKVADEREAIYNCRSHGCGMSDFLGQIWEYLGW